MSPNRFFGIDILDECDFFQPPYYCPFIQSAIDDGNRKEAAI
jgi:hypothetical protein